MFIINLFEIMERSTRSDSVAAISVSSAVNFGWAMISAMNYIFVTMFYN